MQTSGDLMMLVAGIGVGAAAAVLLTDRSGADLRKSIRQQAAVLATKAETASMTGHHAVGVRLVQTKTAVRVSGERAVHQVNSAVDAAGRIADSLLDHSGELARRASKLAQQT